MDRQGLDIAMVPNFNGFEMPRVHEVADASITDENAELYVSEKALEPDKRKNTKEIKMETSVHATKKSTKSVTQQETEKDTSPTTVVENTNSSEKNTNHRSNLKRKTFANEASEDVTGQNRVVNAITDAENFEGNETVNAKNPKRKPATHPSTSQMVLESFNLRKRNGISAEGMEKDVKENFQVSIKRINPHMSKFLQKNVADGLLQQSNGSGAEEKINMKKAETVRKNTEMIQKAGRNLKKIAEKVKEATRKVKRNKKLYQGRV